MYFNHISLVFLGDFGMPQLPDLQPINAESVKPD